MSFKIIEYCAFDLTSEWFGFLSCPHFIKLCEVDGIFHPERIIFSGFVVRMVPLVTGFTKLIYFVFSHITLIGAQSAYHSKIMLCLLNKICVIATKNA